MTDATESIHCGHCGHEQPPGAEVCAACGASLAAWQSVSDAVPEARQPTGASTPASSALPAAPPVNDDTRPAEWASSRPASPIGDALARIRERAAAEHAAQPVAAPEPTPSAPSAIAFAPSPAAPAEPKVVPAARPAERVPGNEAPPDRASTPGTPPAVSPPAAETSPVAPAQAALPPVTPPPSRSELTQPARREPQPPPPARRRPEPAPTLTPARRQRPDRLARASAGTLIFWGVGLFIVAFILALALPGAKHQALGMVIVTVSTLLGVVLFISGLARKSGARRPADRRPPRRR